MNSEEDKIELRSEEFQEVLGKIPNWILRWGIFLIAFIVVLLLVGSSLFKYPDVIATKMTLTGTTPPAAIVAKTSGKLGKLYVKDNQKVRIGECLAVIENPAKTEDVLKLKEYMQAFDTAHVIELPFQEIELGRLQNSYSLFYSSLSDYAQFVRSDYFPAKKRFIHQRISQYSSQYQDLLHKREIVREQWILAGRQYARDSMVYAKDGLSVKEFDKSRDQYLSSCLTYEGVSTSLSNLSMQIMQMKEALLDAEHEYTEKGKNLLIRLNIQTSQLATDIRDWEMAYLVSAPIDGKVTFTNYWVENQNVSAGEEVFNIIPTDSVGLVGKALLPMTRSGKVKVGQKVNIRFDNFPENEFGMVKGHVKNISLVPVTSGTETFYAVEVTLDRGLHTSYGRELPFLPQMKAQADIVTEQMSLLERFFMPLRKLWNGNRNE